jgi:chloramphenicol-sensitive protein RarD
LPWISLVLAVTFGLYGVLRKRMGVDAVSGMFIETMLLFPPAILYLVWMQISGQPLFFGGGAANIGLAMAAGVVTVVPLILFHAGNKALPITIAGMLFYANPTTQLLIGLFYFDAPFAPQEWLNFGVIWAGLVVYFSTRRTET